MALCLNYLAQLTSEVSKGNFEKEPHLTSPHLTSIRWQIANNPDLEEFLRLRPCKIFMKFWILSDYSLRKLKLYSLKKRKQNLAPQQINFHESLFEGGKWIFLHSKCDFMPATTISLFNFFKKIFIYTSDSKGWKKAHVRKNGDKQRCLSFLTW